MNTALQLTVQQILNGIADHEQNRAARQRRPENDRHFVTNPCKHCSDVRRYKSNKACVTCHSTKAALAWAKKTGKI